jgi:hypothetical protein
MILEGLITTCDCDGSPHLAPMGPDVHSDFSRFTLRPFPTSHTYQNLHREGQGVLHVTDDALLLAQSAVGALHPFPKVRPATRIKGFILVEACRHYEFVVQAIDDSQERVRIQAQVVHSEVTREFFGFNRAKHAVVEAAILATRLHFLAHAEVEREFSKLRMIVDKTGGPPEKQAMDLLEAKLRDAEASR